ncbi:hypothetical protein FRC03_003933 [Tulasnella sp. 419]|nr:hypothetical protein FRC03_003933 [Tulasnella sp. 419]
MSEIVIREVAAGVWTFSKPFARFNLFPVGGRSTAVKLRNGGVWVIASTPLTEETKNKLDELGDVKYLIGPDAVHHLFLGEFKKQYPQAKVIGVEPLVEKKKGELKFDGVYGVDPPDTKYGFEDEIDACYFSGFRNKDVAFCHKASKSLIVADLLFNLPAREQYSKAGGLGWAIFKNGQLSPYKDSHKHFVWSLGADPEAMRKHSKIVADWDFDKIIMCHGDVIEKDGKAAWREAYKWWLD